MLELKNIVKEYKLGGHTYTALKDVSIKFRKSEFVSILGASGSGKTTMLNIIGGLDKYTSGEMWVNGKSTKDFKDKNWDAYRNATIGFVFQSYNLISHISVLDNVKLALSISGISSKQARLKSIKALEEVGLLEHINKKPSQLSGGQMQRVAIARALVTDPKIILADEPTGALDSKTSVQIMELIKKISQDKLVIMVTHNPELAKTYSDRIVKVSDGNIIEDTNAYVVEENANESYKEVKTAMSLKDSIKSSFNNLLTKKVRTMLTTLAGSIGIISIGLVLSISSGMQGYINKLENENLSSMPITINASQSDMNFGSRLESNEENNTTSIKVSQIRELHKNNYTEDILGNGQTFIKYLEENAKDNYKNIDYSTNYQIKSVVNTYEDKIQEVKIQGARTFRSSIFGRLPEDKNILLNQYKIVAKQDSNFDYPTKAEEAMLFVGLDNSIDKSVLRALGFNDDANFDYKDLLGKEISVLTNDAYYKEIEGFYTINKLDKDIYDQGTKVKIVAIAKPSDDLSVNSYAIGYTKSLEDKLLNEEKNSQIVVKQKENRSTNIFTKEEMTADEAESLIDSLGANEKPAAISIYPKSFEDREKIEAVIKSYNKKIAEKFGENSEAYHKNIITYTDMGKMMTELMTKMITTISVILIAFAAISLIVSSVMIGILTYVSVVERTKEIGILRAIGARKKDITRIFNAEAGIVGLSSGLFGVVITALLSIPISSAVSKAISAEGFVASLSVKNSIYLILLSLVLTLVASVIPARIAAKKDPVEALRSE